MRASQLIGIGMLLVAGMAQAQVTGTVTAVSDYDFRGISQTREDPALQGSIDWAGSTGWYAGAWGSNVDFGDESESDLEIDAYFGYARESEEGLGWDVGLMYYSYWPDDDDINYPELYAGVSYGLFDFKAWYSPDYVNSSDPSLYLEGNANVELPQGFGVRFHVGHYSGDGIEAETGDKYLDYSVGLTKSFGNFDFELKYVDTDIDENDEDIGDARVILGVSTTFPWGRS